MMFSVPEWTPFPDQDPETFDNIKLSDAFLSEFNTENCEQVDQFLDGDRFIKYDIYINWGLWVRFNFIDFYFTESYRSSEILEKSNGGTIL